MMDTLDLVRDTLSPFSFWNMFLPMLSVLKMNMAEGEGGEATFTQTEVDAKVAEAVGAAKSGAGEFFSGFEQGVKEHPSITRYKSTEELAKGHIELEKKIGLKGVLVPGEGSSDQVKNDFYKATGRPDKPELYANPILDNLHEGVKTTSEQDLKAFKDKAFEIGLSSKQFDSMYDWYLQLQSQR